MNNLLNLPTGFYYPLLYKYFLFELGLMMKRLHFFIVLSVLFLSSIVSAMEVEEVVEKKATIPSARELAAKQLAKKLFENYKEWKKNSEEKKERKKRRREKEPKKAESPFAELEKLPVELRAGVLKEKVSGNDTLLHYLVSEGDIEQLEYLLSLGAPPDAKGFAGKTPLRYAAAQNKVNAINVLLRYGASINAKDAQLKEMPLMEAVGKNNVNAIQALLNGGTSLNTTNRFGETALHIAAKKSNIETLNMLLEFMRDKNVLAEIIDKQDVLGRTPLMDAAQRGDTQIVRKLLEAGANKSIQTPSDISAVGYARLNNHDEVGRLIEGWSSE